jgi:hypothetical protein
MTRKGWIMGGITLVLLVIALWHASGQQGTQNSMSTLENSVAQEMTARGAPDGTSGAVTLETCSPVPGVPGEFYCVGRYPDQSTREWTVDVNSSGGWVTVP